MNKNKCRLGEISFIDTGVRFAN